MSKENHQKQKHTFSLAFDAQSKRSKDENGFLHVSSSHISKEVVNPYYGYEIPGYVEQGLDPEKVYYGYRKGIELEKAAKTFNGLPLLLGHYEESADNPQKEHRVGSLGTDAVFASPYLDNSLIITDAKAIDAIESGEAVQISCSYRYEPVFTSGEFDGYKYDFIMTNIRGNHVALVEEGRAGKDINVADSALPNKKDNNQKKGKIFMGKLTTLAKKLLVKSGIATDEAPIVEAAEQFIETVGEETVETALESTRSFDDELQKILEDDTLDVAQKTEAIKKLAELTNELTTAIESQENIEDIIDAFGNEPEKTAAATDDELDIDDLMKKAGLDPSDEKVKTVFMAGIVAGAKPDQEEKKEEQKKEEEKDPPLTAKDANSIKQQARDEATVATQRHIMELTKASQHVRDLCGEVDPFAFDSASAIYTHALTSVGHKVSTKDSTALKDMVSMAKDSKAKGAFQRPVPALQKMDGHFKGLTRIKTEQ